MLCFNSYRQFTYYRATCKSVCSAFWLSQRSNMPKSCPKLFYFTAANMPKLCAQHLVAHRATSKKNYAQCSIPHRGKCTKVCLTFKSLMVKRPIPVLNTPISHSSATWLMFLTLSKASESSLIEALFGTGVVAIGASCCMKQTHVCKPDGAKNYTKKLRILEQAAGHLLWKFDYPPPQPAGSGFESLWRLTTN